MEDFRSPDVVAMKMRVNDMADRKPTHFAELLEGGGGSFRAFGGVDHNHTFIGNDIENIADGVTRGAIDSIANFDEFRLPWPRAPSGRLRSLFVAALGGLAGR